MYSTEVCVLHPDFSTLHHRGLDCTWTCLDLFGQQEPVQAECAAPGRVYTTGAWAAPGRTWVDYCTGACAAPRLVYTAEACDLYVLTLQGPELHLDVSTPQGPEPSPERVYTTEACDAPGSCLHHSGLSCTCMCLCLLLEVSTLQGPELHLDVSTPQCLSYTCVCLWTPPPQRSLCYSWTCLHYNLRESRRFWSNINTRYLYEGVVVGILLSLVEAAILYGALNISPP
jgi:hypothetical protein